MATIPRLPRVPRKRCDQCNRPATITAFPFDGEQLDYCDFHLGFFAGGLIRGNIQHQGLYWLTTEQWQAFDEEAAAVWDAQGDGDE